MKGLLHHDEGLVLVLQAQTIQNQGKEPGQTILRNNTWGKKTGVMSTWMMPLGTDNRDYILESSTADCTMGYKACRRVNSSVPHGWSSWVVSIFSSSVLVTASPQVFLSLCQTSQPTVGTERLKLPNYLLPTQFPLWLSTTAIE